MNTASSTSELATTALVISRIAAEAPANGSIRFSLTKRAMFSMTTMASSTTSPVARVSPNSVRVLIEKPSTFINAKVPIRETGIVIAGISVVRHDCRNRNTTAITSTIEIPSVLTTSRDRLADERGRIEAELVGDAVREVRLQLVHRRAHVAGDLQRVRARQREHRDPDRVLAGEAQVRRVALGAELDPPDVAQAHVARVGIRAQDQRAELGRRAQPPDRAHGDLRGLIGGDRRGADRPGGDGDVLVLERGDDVGALQN